MKRDCCSHVTRNFSRQVDSSDANEAKMFALQVDSQELLKLGEFKDFLKGNSFLILQWGTGKTADPLRLADWVEEVQEISRQLGTSFHHIL